MALATSPSTVRSPSRPSKRDTVPRPHTATVPPPASPASPASANDEPNSSSRPVTARDHECPRSRSPRSHSARPAAASESRARPKPPEDLRPCVPPTAGLASGESIRPESVPSSGPDPPSPVASPSPVPASGRQPMRWPASDTSTPGARAARIRLSTAPSTCSATVRPNRASHARGIASAFSMVPVALASASFTLVGDGFESASVSVSFPSSYASSSTGTETVRLVSPAAKVSVPAVSV